MYDASTRAFVISLDDDADAVPRYGIGDVRVIRAREIDTEIVDPEVELDPPASPPVFLTPRQVALQQPGGRFSEPGDAFWDNISDFVSSNWRTAARVIGLDSDFQLPSMEENRRRIYEALTGRDEEGPRLAVPIRNQNGDTVDFVSLPIPVVEDGEFTPETDPSTRIEDLQTNVAVDFGQRRPRTSGSSRSPARRPVLPAPPRLRGVTSVVPFVVEAVPYLIE